jgi:hypothetical protein
MFLHLLLIKVLLAIRKHGGEHADYHCKRFEEVCFALRELLHLKELIHTVYCVNNFHLRRSICLCVFKADLAGEEHRLDKICLLPSHSVFNLEFSTLNTLFDQTPQIQKQILKDADLMINMFKALNPPPQGQFGFFFSFLFFYFLKVHFFFLF